MAKRVGFCRKRRLIVLLVVKKSGEARYLAYG
jgi:hypothetical protein